MKDWYSGLAEMGNRLLEGLHTLDDLDGVGDVRGLGMMAAVEIVQDKTTKASYPALAVKVGARLHKEMLHHGLYTRARGDVVCLSTTLSDHCRTGRSYRRDLAASYPGSRAGVRASATA